ncbi:30S ribosomal protein S16 [Patescibacteria group bacterium]|nr:30S ribosomal protein S16 [Patescibacteria group bacterium]
MLAIRLQRIGKKNRPSYRVVVSEKKRDLYGRHNEILGNYDPVANPKVINLKADRIKYWISFGAQPSATVHNLLVTQGIIEGKKVKAWVPKKKKEKEEKPAQGGSASGGEEPKKDEAPN